MFKVSILILSCWLFPALVSAQNYTLDRTIPVQVDGRTLPYAWAGGLTAPQFNTMDLNRDGVEDIVVFDRLSSRVVPFLRIGQTWDYAPEYSSIFPDVLDDWVLLRDFNGDGKKDVFVSTPLGMQVYVNTSDDESFSWRLFHSREPGPSPLLTQGFTSAINLQLNASDIPAIEDIDGDGDLDILVFRFAGGSSVEYHRNFSIERDGNLDSLQMQRETSAWGAFRECLCGTFAFDGEDCGPVPGRTFRPLHEGGKTLTVADLNGDGLPEAMVSEETCDELFYLENGGTVEEAHMTGLLSYLPDQEYPFFPASFLEDIDGDGLADMILASNWPAATENLPETLPLLFNSGTTQLPDFSLSTNRFLLEDMIDAGGLSHPAFMDLNGDGLTDMLVGHYADESVESPTSGLWYFENTGTRAAPAFALQSKDYVPSVGAQGLFSIRPDFLDVNGDGRMDLVFSAVTSNETEGVYYILNNDAVNNPFGSAPQLLFSQLASQDIVSYADINDDNVPDLLVGRNSGSVELYLGIREGGILTFTFEEDGFAGLSADIFRGPTLVRVLDVNGDGIEDLFYADRAGGTAWLNNFRSSGQQWESVTLWSSEEEGEFRGGRNLAPAVVNLLNLNSEQLVFGSAGGGLQYFRPDNAVTVPVPEVISLYPNPVDSDYFILQAPGVVEGVIIDTMGRVITKGMQITPGERVDTSALPDGFYILRILSDNGRRESLPFIVR